MGGVKVFREMMGWVRLGFRERMVEVKMNVEV